MKSSELMISIIFASLFLLTPAFAQTVPIRVTVPFDFTVGDQRLPAGEYRVAIVSDSALRVLRMDESTVAHVVTTFISGGPNLDPTPKLIFHRYGDRRFLFQVWTGEVGRELFASASESEYARTTKQESVTVAAK
jgi:hypothetical protein